MTDINNKKQVITIGGPTASGKSGFALHLAEQLNGVIVNFDSMQLYNGLHILTAHPSIDDLNKVPHRLYSILEPNETSFSAASWRKLALIEIENIISDNKVPILVGGTGFYQKALIEGLSPIPDSKIETRASLKEKLLELDMPQFYEEFAKLDPLTAAKIDRHNTQRIARAWEILIDTGKPLALWQQEPPIAPPAHLKFTNINILPEREMLYANCNLRFDLMIKQGVIEEIIAFKNKYQNQNITLNNALGYKELCEFIDNKISLEQAIEKAQQSTRNYAKRQVTWFKNQVKADITVINPKEEVELITKKLTEIVF